MLISYIFYTHLKMTLEWSKHYDFLLLFIITKSISKILLIKVQYCKLHSICNVAQSNEMYYYYHKHIT